ncbi:MAG: hypothetical protein GF398_12150 [Chitinivibrionales bacterium]|nr:hypothetical protein [Chitinivibrionales bacterium]
MEGAGGTSGGISTFLIGLVMAVAGGYLITNQVTVTSTRWRFYSFHLNPFGMALIPFIFGIGFLFFNGKSIAGWLLTGGGLVIIFVGIINSLHIYFRPTTLFNTLVMIVLLIGGIGLIARSLRAS